jgi:hypothetical protein
MKLRPAVASVLLLLASLRPSSAGAVPVVPGATVEPYGTAEWPAWMSFDRQSGALFTGVETGPQAFVWRVEAGGGAADPYGASPILDPDAVVHDPQGAMTGVPGSLLVGGRSGGTPLLFGILNDPAQTVVTVFGPSGWTNLSDMEFDPSGRLLFGDENGTTGRVFAASNPNQPPVVLFAVTGRVAGLEVDAAGRIYTSTFDGRVRIHAADGSVVSDPFLSGLGNRLLPIALGPGGPWGTDLYTVNQVTGQLIRADAFADTTVIGTGFDGFLMDFEFGPDGALYVSDLGLGLIWRIAFATTDVASAPAEIGLRIEHPNPARPPFAIRYTLPASSRARLRIFDVQGRWIRTLVDGGSGAGVHVADWDGRDAGGQSVASGVYWCRLDVNLGSQSSKILLLP